MATPCSLMTTRDADSVTTSLRRLCRRALARDLRSDLYRQCASSGADTVIMQEDVERYGDDVTFLRPLTEATTCASQVVTLLRVTSWRAGKVLQRPILHFSLIGASTVEMKRRLGWCFFNG